MSYQAAMTSPSPCVPPVTRNVFPGIQRDIEHGVKGLSCLFVKAAPSVWCCAGCEMYEECSTHQLSDWTRYLSYLIAVERTSRAPIQTEIKDQDFFAERYGSCLMVW